MLLFGLQVLGALASQHTYYQLQRFAVQCRATMMAGIHRKCLQLSSAALSKATSGKIVTLMSNDAAKLEVGSRATSFTASVLTGVLAWWQCHEQPKSCALDLSRVMCQGASLPVASRPAHGTQAV